MKREWKVFNSLSLGHYDQIMEWKSSPKEIECNEDSRGQGFKDSSGMKL
jgi:hypothetical protein